VKDGYEIKSNDLKAFDISSARNGDIYYIDFDLRSVQKLTEFENIEQVYLEKAVFSNGSVLKVAKYDFT
jgi:hypothetical protein